MINPILDFFEIDAQYNLNILDHSQDPFATSEMLLSIRNVIEKEQPDFLLVHGDTTTTMVGAIRGFIQH